MPTISVRKVKKSRILRVCERCLAALHKGKPYLDLYGMAFRGDKPWHLPLCILCGKESPDEKVKVAAEELYEEEGY